MAPSKENETSTKHILHWVIHALYGVVLACGGFITSQIFSNLAKIEEKVDATPMIYVQKSDYKDDQDKLANAIIELGHKIDSSTQRTEDDYNDRLDKIEAIIINKLNR